MGQALAPPQKAIHSYEDIEAFQRAMTLLKPIHELALSLPDYERFDLIHDYRIVGKQLTRLMERWR